jgi:hypothetical protein
MRYFDDDYYFAMIVCAIFLIWGVWAMIQRRRRMSAVELWMYWSGSALCLFLLWGWVYLGNRRATQPLAGFKHALVVIVASWLFLRLRHIRHRWMGWSLTAVVLVGGFCVTTSPWEPWGWLHAFDHPLVAVDGGVMEVDGPDIEVQDFALGSCEVTQGQWYRVMKKVPGDAMARATRNSPVRSVSWYEAIEYCNRRSQMEGLTPCYTIDKKREDPENLSEYDEHKWLVTWNREANGYRLPTFFEWLFAYHGGMQSRGYAFSGSDHPEDVGWRQYPYNCGTKEANELGIYDMTSGVMELVWDWDDSHQEKLVIYHHNYISGISPNTKSSGCGFRVARNSL